ncbi:hypothetical protein GCM10009117_12480 [Gangjinia marincola]|uniref:LVIVD repeat-containing protein n=2 Tax=Gangjinia marincola TaxID=578463 RepID=A0ABN1MG53_9FLAO
MAALIVSCSNDSDSSSLAEGPSSDGQGGSMARFALKGDYLYTVDEFDLNVFNIQDATDPVKVNSQNIGFAIETLFSYKDYLYVGSRNGMFVYSVDNPEFPEQLSAVQHFTACDPVVANDTHAFVTLQNSSGCGGTVNQLEVYDITDTTNPVLINTRSLSEPKGLGLYGNYLFVCDDEIKVFDITDPSASVLVASINKNAFDVIIQNDLLIAIGENGLYQYALNPNDVSDISALSVINI